MALEEKLGGALKKSWEYISTKRDDIHSYLRNNKLKNYFENIPEEERKERESRLERYVDESVAKYSGELQGMARKIGTRTAMASAVFNDLYSIFVSNAPFRNFSAISYVLFGAKTLMEVPAMYRYIKKSHDWYGALEWSLMKPVDYILPVIGPMIESGLFERIVKRRVSYEARSRFLESIGAEGEKGRAKNVLKMPLKEKLHPDIVEFNPEEAYA